MLSELEAHISETGYKARFTLQHVLDQKSEIQDILTAEELSVLEERRLQAMLVELDSAIQQYRVFRIA